MDRAGVRGHGHVRGHRHRLQGRLKCGRAVGKAEHEARVVIARGGHAQRATQRGPAPREQLLPRGQGGRLYGGRCLGGATCARRLRRAC